MTRPCWSLQFAPPCSDPWQGVFMNPRDCLAATGTIQCPN